MNGRVTQRKTPTILIYRLLNIEGVADVSTSLNGRTLSGAEMGRAAARGRLSPLSCLLKFSKFSKKV